MHSGPLYYFNVSLGDAGRREGMHHKAKSSQSSVFSYPQAFEVNNSWTSKAESPQCASRHHTKPTEVVLMLKELSLVSLHTVSLRPWVSSPPQIYILDNKIYQLIANDDGLIGGRTSFLNDDKGALKDSEKCAVSI